MLINCDKLNRLSEGRNLNARQIGSQLVRGGLTEKQAMAAISNWRRGLFKPAPRRVDVRRLASLLGVEENELLSWRSSYRYAPVSVRKARLVTDLVKDRSVQDALDTLKFTRKRAAGMVEKVLKAAVADADEQEADVENLYVSEAFADDAGVRIGTKRWIPKDRGRAHPIRKSGCHIHVTVTQI